MNNNIILTTRELSKYLKLNEKTVIKMAQTGDLPGFKIGNQWRFYLSTIDEYLQDKIAKSSKHDFSGSIQEEYDILPLSRFIDESCINIDMKAKDRDGALYELAETAENAGITASSMNLLIQLKKREQMLSTALGNGIAIPHPRNPSDVLFIRSAVVIGRSKNGVDFSAPDGKKTNLFFLSCATDVVLHLKLLSKIAALLETEGIIKRLMAAGSGNDITKILLSLEKGDILPVAGS